MKKALIIIGIALGVILVALVAAGFYIVNANLAMEHRGQDIEGSYKEMKGDYPEMIPWLDSLQKTGGLKDSTLLRDGDTKVHYYYAFAPQHTGKTAVVCHGYTDNAIRMFMIARIYNQVLGYNIIVPDMPHAGNSEPNHISMGYYESQIARKLAASAQNIFGDDTTKVEIVVHGISMGAATTMMTVGDDNVNKELNIKCAVEDCGYTSCWDEFSQEITNSYGIPPFPLLYVADLVCDIKNGWCFHDASPLEAVKNTSLPIFFIHGDNDNFVPTKMVHTLYDAKTKGDKELWVAKSSEHAFSYHDNKDEYIQKTKQFVEKYME